VDTTPPIIKFFDSDGNELHDGDTIGNPYLQMWAWFWDEFGMSAFSPYNSGQWCDTHNWYYDRTEGFYIYTVLSQKGTYYLSSSPDYQQDSYTLTATATDLAGNVNNTASITLHFSMGPRVIAETPMNGQWVNTATPEVSAEFYVPHGSLANGKIAIDSIGYGGTVAGSKLYVNPTLSEGTHSVSVTADNHTTYSCYNPYNFTGYYSMSEPYQWSFGVDTVPPTLTSATITNGVLTVTGADATSGVDIIELQIDGCNGHFRPYALNGDAVQFDTTGLQAGDYDIVGTIFDKANNFYAFKTTLTISDEAEEELDEPDDAGVEGYIIRIEDVSDKPNVEEKKERPLQPTEDIWIGERCWLKAELKNANTEIVPVNYNWHIGGSDGGSAIGGWIANKEVGSRIDLDSTQKEIQIYWWRGLHEKEHVYCSMGYGEDLMANTSDVLFTIKKPAFSFKSEYGATPADKTNKCPYGTKNPVPMLPAGTNVQYDDERKPALGLGIFDSMVTETDMPTQASYLSTIQPDPTLFNITGFTCHVAFTQGSWKSNDDSFKFVQVIRADRFTRWKNEKENGVYPSTDAVMINTEPAESPLSSYFDENGIGKVYVDCDPDRAMDRYEYGGEPEEKIFDMNLAQQWTCDRPRNRLHSDKWSQASRAYGFNMHLMYRPKTTDNAPIFVPLKTSVWGYFARASQQTNADGTFNQQWIKETSIPEPYIEDKDPEGPPEWLGNSRKVMSYGQQFSIDLKQIIKDGNW
jgi:hypothetical protein